jgi:hypothetical protein
VQPLLRDRLCIHVPRHVADEDLAKVSIVSHVAEVLGARGATGLISLGGGGPYAKPTIQVISGRGEALGFVKVGWDEVTARLVSNEARALRLCAKGPLQTLRVPRLLHAGRWNGLELSVVSPLPAGARRYPHKALPPLAITKEVCGLTGGSSEPVWTSPFADRLREQAERKAPGTTADQRPSSDLLVWLRERYADARLVVGAWHGDWVPWNLAMYGPHVYAWDWENSGDSVPLGFDVVHFYFQSAFIRDRLRLTDAIRRSRAASSEPLRRLGIPDSLVGLVRTLYLLEVGFRAEEVGRLGGKPNPDLYPAILEILRRPQDLVD